MPADARALGGRFGLALVDFGLLLPAGMLCEFVVAADVFPLPGAPPHLRGLMQRHGRPIPVFGLIPEPVSGIRVASVLILGAGREAGAIEVDQAPEPVDIAGAALGAPTAPARLPSGVLTRPCRCVGRAELYWQFEPATLFGALGRAADV